MVTHNKVNNIMLLVLFMLILPIFTLVISIAHNNNVSADSLDFNVNVEQSINITIPSSTVTLDLSPDTISGSFNTSDLTVSVSSNVKNGYSLYMSASSTNLTRSEAISSDTTPVIPTLDDNESGYSESDFTTNRWGYKTDNDTNYYAFPVTSELMSNTAPTNNDSTTLTFAAKADITKPAGSYETTLTFAVIPKYSPPTIESMYYMQDFAGLTDSDKESVLASMTEEEAYTLYDIRDNEDYKVSKLKDGNVWLLDNLRLDLTDSAVLANMDSTNTNASDTTLGYLKNGGGTMSDQYATASASAEWTMSTDNWTVPRISVANKNVVAASYGLGSGVVGAYYNYCASTAGSYCYSKNGNTGNAVYDICPADWRMPTGNSVGEYQILYSNYSTTNAASSHYSIQYNLSTPMAGYFLDGWVGDLNSYGRYWSSSVYDGTMMHMLVVGADLVDAHFYAERAHGFSVRCLLDI